MRRALHKRRWLEPGNGDADSYIKVYAEGADLDSSFCYTYDDVSVKIADCTRSVYLEFGFDRGNKASIRRRIKKMDRLLTTLYDVAEYLELALMDADADKERINEHTKERKRQKAEREAERKADDYV